MLVVFFGLPELYVPPQHSLSNKIRTHIHTTKFSDPALFGNFPKLFPSTIISLHYCLLFRIKFAFTATRVSDADICTWGEKMMMLSSFFLPLVLTIKFTCSSPSSPLIFSITRRSSQIHLSSLTDWKQNRIKKFYLYWKRRAEWRWGKLMIYSINKLYHWPR